MTRLYATVFSLLSFAAFSLPELPRVSIQNEVPNEFFISLEASELKLLDSPAILKSQHLFEDKYWIKVAPGFQLPQAAGEKWLQKNTRSQKRDLMLSARDAEDPKERSSEDPRIGQQYALKASSEGGMNVEQHHEQVGDAERRDVVVAVVDTGVDFNHEDLSSKMWKNEAEIPGDGIDNDENGYVDDVYGVNTLIRDEEGNATVDVRDTHGHGTHVAGIIGAARGNAKGIAGVSEGARIMAIRTVPNSGDETDRDVVEAFLYAARNGADVINCSFGKYHNEGGDIVEETIDYIGREYGVLVVAASGNSSKDIDETPVYPASLDNENLLVIGATDRRGRRAWFSNYGETSVDLAAPGVDVLSTTPNNRYQYFSGTSMASPNAAGAVAELLSLNPDMSGLEAKARILASAHLKEHRDFWFAVRGIVDLLAANNH